MAFRRKLHPPASLWISQLRTGRHGVVQGRRQGGLPPSRGRDGRQEGDARGAGREARVPDDQDPAQRHDGERPSRQRRPCRPAQGDRRADGLEGPQGADRWWLRDAEELEPALQAQPRQDEDRRHLRARRGGYEPLPARPREGSLDGREADVREGEEDPRQRADVREGHGRGRGGRVARRRPRARRQEEEAGRQGRRYGLVRLSVWAVLAAAGRGERLGSDRPEAFARLGGRPLLAESLERLEESGWIDAIVIAAPPDWEEPSILVAEEIAATKVSSAVTGGESRSGSVRVARAAGAAGAAVVLVHDAARPLVSEAVIERVLAPLSEGWDGVVPAVPLADTVKRVEGDRVVETVRRDDLVAVQTPQAFLADVLRRAVEADVSAATDCASLVEAQGGRVKVVDGDPRLLKVTDADDLALVESWLA